MVRDSILADERSSGAEDGLLRKTQTEEKKRRYLGAFLQARGSGAEGARGSFGRGVFFFRESQRELNQLLEEPVLLGVVV